MNQHRGVVYGDVFMLCFVLNCSFQRGFSVLVLFRLHIAFLYSHDVKCVLLSDIFDNWI